MLGRLKVVLPTVNVAVATLLLGVGYTRPLREWSPVPWEMGVCFSINAPANLLRLLLMHLWDKRVYPHCSDANARTCLLVGDVLEIGIFLIVVGIIWHLVGLEIESRGAHKRAIVPSSTPLRAGVDLVLLTGAALLTFIVVANWRSFRGVFAPCPALYVFCYFAWALAIAVPYSADLIRCIPRGR